MDSGRSTVAKTGKKMTSKAPRKKSEKDSVKWVTKRKAQKKTLVSRTVPPEP